MAKLKKMPIDKPTGRKENETISTQASAAYDRLQADILTGKLQPGHKLLLKELIEKYGVGNSPMREALNRLSANGMVIREENRGFRVPPANTKDLLELTRTRCWLEEIALRESITKGDGAWEERIVLAFHWLARTERKDTQAETISPEWEERHRKYHEALISACDSKILMEFCADLTQRTIRYRNLAEVVAYRDRHELEEHEALQRAVLNRDANLAVGLLYKHYEVTSEILVASSRFE